MGVFWVKATGFEQLLAVAGMDFPAFMEKLNSLTERKAFQGNGKMTRYDVAGYLIMESIWTKSITRFWKNLKFKWLSERGDGTKRNFIDKVLNLDEKNIYVGTGQNIETLYVKGTRKGKSAFLRFITSSSM